MNSELLKYYGLEWLKFRANCEYIATEFGRYYADVMGMNHSCLYEIEIKCSKADFKKEFEKHKHRIYMRAGMLTPNLFYFLVTTEIRDFCLKYLEANKSPYGLMAFEDDSYGHFYNYAKVYRRAKKLHKKEPEEYVKQIFLMRMGNEIITCWRHKFELLESLNRRPALFKKWEQMLEDEHDWEDEKDWENSND